MVVRDTSEEGSYGKMLHHPYSTSLNSVLIFEKHKNDMSGLRKYFGINIDMNTLMKKILKGNYVLERNNFTVIGANNISKIDANEYEELLKMAANYAQEKMPEKDYSKPPSVRKLMETFCELTGTPFEKTRSMCLGQMERKLEKVTGRLLEPPYVWKSYDFY